MEVGEVFMIRRNLCLDNEVCIGYLNVHSLP